MQTLTEEGVFEQIVEDEWIPCESFQCGLPVDHRAKWIGHTSCGHHIFGCDIARKRWLMNTVDGDAYHWICSKCGTWSIRVSVTPLGS